MSIEHTRRRLDREKFIDKSREIHGYLTKHGLDFVCSAPSSGAEPNCALTLHFFSSTNKGLLASKFWLSRQN